MQGFDSVASVYAVAGTGANWGGTALLLSAVIGVKIVATAVCRASGLVGGQYAPCIFIGSAIGAAFWRCLSACGWVGFVRMEVYALVGAAAMLAAFCRVPLTSTFLLFELTHTYTIVVPALAAVGIARWSSTVGRRAARKLFNSPVVGI